MFFLTQKILNKICVYGKLNNEQLSLLGLFQIRNRIKIKIQGTFMSQIRLKFELLGKFIVYWNLTRKLVNTPSCQLNLPPKNLMSAMDKFFD
jgi:hypothetical protein